jgi:hypothetical protein
VLPATVLTSIRERGAYERTARGSGNRILIVPFEEWTLKRVHEPFAGPKVTGGREVTITEELPRKRKVSQQKVEVDIL